MLCQTQGLRDRATQPCPVARKDTLVSGQGLSAPKAYAIRTNGLAAGQGLCGGGAGLPRAARLQRFCGCLEASGAHACCATRAYHPHCTWLDIRIVCKDSISKRRDVLEAMPVTRAYTHASTRNLSLAASSRTHAARGMTHFSSVALRSTIRHRPAATSAQ